MDAKKKMKRKRRQSRSLVDQLDAQYGEQADKMDKPAKKTPQSSKKRARDSLNAGSSKRGKIDELPLVINFLQNALQFGCKIPEHKAKAIIASKVTGKVILLDNPQRDKDRSVQETAKRQRRRKRKDRKKMGVAQKRDMGLFDFGPPPPEPTKTEEADAKMGEVQDDHASLPATEAKQHQNSGNRKKMSSKKKKKKKKQKPVVDYKKHLPLLRMWQTYMADMICKEAEKDKGNQKEAKHGQQRWQSDILLNADYHGCEFSVIQSRCPSYVGVEGIVLQETQNTFKVLVN